MSSPCLHTRGRVDLCLSKRTTVACARGVTQGAEYTKWRQTCSAVREAGGISSLTALTASGPDRRIARDALGVLVSMICGSGMFDSL
jgi:hypothetical protein